MLPIQDNHPLLLSNLNAKAQHSADAFVSSSVRVVDGYGRNGAKRPAFNDSRALAAFGSWCYKANMINAKGVARSKLRHYAATPPGTKKSRDFKTKSAWRAAVADRLAQQAKGETLDNRVMLYETRPVPVKRKRFMRGESRISPSDRVVAKVAEMGADFEEVTEPTPAMKLLAKPNPWMTGFDLLILKMTYLQITGNYYQHHVEGGRLGIPTELWPMPSQWTRIIPSQQTLIAGYAYGRDTQTERKFGVDEVTHWKLSNPRDPFFYGMGCVEAVWDALDLHAAKRDQDAAKFRNHGRPDWLLIVKNGGSTEMLDRLEEQVDSKLRGTRNAGKFLTMTGEVDAKMLNQQIDLVGDADVIIEEIAAGFDVPVTKLKANDPNRANADAADEGWLRDTILPYLSMDEEMLNSKYLPLFGGAEDSLLAYDNPVPEDSVKEVKRVTDLRMAAIISADEGREEQGYGPAADGGDVLLAPRGSTVVGRTEPDNDLALGDSPDGEDAIEPKSDRPSLTSEQIASIRQIVSDASTGKLPRDAGLAMLKLMFPLSDEQAAAMMGDVGTMVAPAQPSNQNEPSSEPERPASGGGSSKGTVRAVVAVAPGGVSEADAQKAAHASAKTEAAERYLREHPELTADEVDSVNRGHGVYKGSCGHTDSRCRCGDGGVYQMTVPCYRCQFEENDGSDGNDGRRLSGTGGVRARPSQSGNVPPDHARKDVEHCSAHPPSGHGNSHGKTGEAPSVEINLAVSVDASGLAAPVIPAEQSNGSESATTTQSKDPRDATADKSTTPATARDGERQAEGEICRDAYGLSGVRIQESTDAGGDHPQIANLQGNGRVDAGSRKAIGRIGADGLAAPLPQGTALKSALQLIFAAQCQAVESHVNRHTKSIETKDDDRNDTPPAPKNSLTPAERAAELDKIAADWVDVAAWTKRMADVAEPMLTVTARVAAREMTAQLGVDVFSVVDRNLPKAMADLALKFSESTNATTTLQLDAAKDQLRKELLDGTVEGDTRQELTKRVQKVFDLAEKERAETIAQTETSRAIHDAELTTAKESGVVKTKSWLASADACDKCLEMAALGEIPLDKPYATSDYGDVDGPPLHPNCQCSQLLQLKDLSEVETHEPGPEAP